MNYTSLKKELQYELNDLLERRANLRGQTDVASNFEYAKLTGEIIATYKAIIMIQDMEIEELADRR